MRILFIVPYAPSVIRVRPYHLIRSLARRGHDLVVLTLCSSSEELLDLQRLAAVNIQVRACRLPAWRSAWNCLGALVTGRPLQSVYSWQPELALELRRAVCYSGCDVIHVEHLRGALYGIHALQLIRNNGRPLPVVWDSVDCISSLFHLAQRHSRSLMGQLMSRIELFSTESHEGWLAGQFDRVLATSEADSNAIWKLARFRGETPELRVLCNGVDLEHFSTSDERRDPATIVLTGKMSYHVNVTAARYLVEEIMPLVWARRPDARVFIVGKSPSREVRALVGSLHGSRGPRRIEVTGAVPDLRPYLRRATVAVAPLLYGAGVQNKVLEAMACGTPVVASPQAHSALAASPGRDLLVGAGAKEFAHNVVALLDDPTLQKEVGGAGRRYVETHHSWDDVAARLEAIYLEAIDSLARRHAAA